MPDHDVGGRGVLARELRAHPHPHGVEPLALQHRVRAREVDVLQQAERGTLGALALKGPRLHARPVDAHDLARLDLAYELRAERVERAGFRGEHPAAAEAAEAERADAERVAHAEQRVRGQQRQRVGPGGAPHHVVEALLPVAPGGGREELREHLGVRPGLELDAALDKVAAQQVGVDDVAVVRERELALRAGDDQRLHVRVGARPGGRVARVADRVRAPEVGQDLLVEDLCDEAHLGEALDPGLAVGGGDAGRLLPAVLERVEAEEGESSHILAGGEDAHHAAGFAQARNQARPFPLPDGGDRQCSAPPPAASACIRA